MLTKESFVAMFAKGKRLSQSTLKARIAFLWKMYRDMGNSADDLTYLSNYNTIMKYIRESEKTEVRKTRLFHVLSLLETPAGKVITADTKKKLKIAANRLREASRTENLDNTMSDKNMANHISIDMANFRLDRAFHDLFNEYNIPINVQRISNEDFNKWNIPSDRKNIKSFARDLQRLMLLAVYVWQPALRSDWGTLEITSASVNRLDPVKNWLQVLRSGRVRIIMNTFKNVSSFGKQIIEVESPTLKRYIKYWIYLLTKLSGESPRYMFLYQLSPVKDVALATVQRDSFAKAVSRASEKYFDKHMTINSFRHAHEMAIQSSGEYQRMTMGEREEAHRKLLHGVFMGQLYNWQRRETGPQS